MNNSFPQRYEEYPHELYYPHSSYYAPLYPSYPQCYYPFGPPNYYYNPFPRQYCFNSGGNWYDGSGIQRNRDVIIEGGCGSDVQVSNHSAIHESREATIIGGCHGNRGGLQVSGDVNLVNGSNM